jgi:hypothetical protein
MKIVLDVDPKKVKEAQKKYSKLRWMLPKGVVAVVDQIFAAASADNPPGTISIDLTEGL